MEGVYILFAVVAIQWLITLIGSLLVLKWSITKTPRRFWAAFAVGLIAVSMSYLGLTHTHFTYSKTVNGSGWAVDSKWFFLASLILSALGLGLTLWNRKKWREPRSDLAMNVPPPQ